MRPLAPPVLGGPLGMPVMAMEGSMTEGPICGLPVTGAAEFGVRQPLLLHQGTHSAGLNLTPHGFGGFFPGQAFNPLASYPLMMAGPAAGLFPHPHGPSALFQFLPPPGMPLTAELPSKIDSDRGRPEANSAANPQNTNPYARPIQTKRKRRKSPDYCPHVRRGAILGSALGPDLSGGKIEEEKIEEEWVSLPEKRRRKPMSVTELEGRLNAAQPSTATRSMDDDWPCEAGTSALALARPTHRSSRCYRMLNYKSYQLVCCLGKEIARQLLPSPESLPLGQTIIHLYDSEGVAWPVTYRVVVERHSFEFRGGWQKLVAGMGLTKSDIVVFSRRGSKRTELNIEVVRRAESREFLIGSIRGGLCDAGILPGPIEPVTTTTQPPPPVAVTGPEAACPALSESDCGTPPAAEPASGAAAPSKTQDASSPSNQTAVTGFRTSDASGELGR